MNKLSFLLKHAFHFKPRKALPSRFERSIHITSFNNNIFEPNRKGKANREFYPFDNMSWTEIIINGKKLFFEECKKFVGEVKEHFINDPKLYSDGDVDVIFRFDKKEDLEKWLVSSDKINTEGFSECSFVQNDKGKAVFYGIIDTTPPKDGKNRYSGYCGIKTLKKQKSFFRMDWYDWTLFTHLVLRVKGDGRNYMINLGMGMYFDINWFDTYTYVFHTHGGPYWQTIKIPFSKFFLTSKGRIQDAQCAVFRSKIDSVGITCAGVPGPFHLEIDYIACEVDFSHKEEFAYELYKIPKEYVSKEL